MKSFFPVIAIFLFSTYALVGQCPTMALTLTTQLEVDNFPTNYLGCENLAQSLFIDGANITNLNGLSALQEIDYFIVKNTSIEDFSGLEFGKC